jgi:hypothetical protein
VAARVHQLLPHVQFGGPPQALCRRQLEGRPPDGLGVLQPRRQGEVFQSQASVEQARQRRTAGVTADDHVAHAPLADGPLDDLLERVACPERRHQVRGSAGDDQPGRLQLSLQGAGRQAAVQAGHD